MADRPQRYSDRPLDEIIDFEYAGGVPIQTIMDHYEGGVKWASRVPSFLAKAVGIPYDRASALDYANKLIDKSARPHQDPSVLGTFYRILDEAGMLNDDMVKSSSPDVARKKLTALLDAVDVDHNGIVTPAEMKAFLHDKNAGPKDDGSRAK